MVHLLQLRCEPGANLQGILRREPRDLTVPRRDAADLVRRLRQAFDVCEAELRLLLQYKGAANQQEEDAADLIDIAVECLSGGESQYAALLEQPRLSASPPRFTITVDVAEAVAHQLRGEATASSSGGAQGLAAAQPAPEQQLEPAAEAGSAPPAPDAGAGRGDAQQAGQGRGRGRGRGRGKTGKATKKKGKG